MTHDVFICHSSKDRTIANAICSKLEQNRIRCWIAPRDVLPGSDYAQSIIEAISGSKLTVLVFSDNSNRSPHVHREIERTVGHGIPILPFRVDDVIPSPSLEYFISDAHWLDAITPPMEQHLDHLVGTLGLLLKRVGEDTSTDQAPAPAVYPPPAPVQPPGGGPSGTVSKLPGWWSWVAVGAVAVAGASIAGVLLLGGRDGGTSTPVTKSQAPTATSTAPATTASTPALAAAPAKATVPLGNAITLAGLDAGDKAAITAMKVVDPTTSTDGVSAPAAGSRYLAVQFQIQNTGTRVYKDMPQGCAFVLDAGGRRFEAATVLSVAAGPVLPLELPLRPGQKGTGYIVFELPAKSKVAKVQFTPNSGFGAESGHWTVR